MGDMGDYFNDLKAFRKEQREKRTGDNIEALFNESEIPAREQGKNVWRVDTPAGAVMYYPGSNCWQHKGKTMRGDVRSFIGWYRKQPFARPQ